MYDSLNLVCKYEVMRERMVDPPPREQFIMFLVHNSFTYEFRCFSMHDSMYYCYVHTYFPDGSTV
jgi:hypothetical protein